MFHGDREDIRRLFPVTQERIHFDHAAEGPLSEPALSEMKRLLQIHSRRGKVPPEESERVLEEARALSAELLTASTQEIAFVKNTSEAILIALSSIPWTPGDNIVLMEDAFPANIYPLEHLLPDVEKRWVRFNSNSRRNPHEDFLERLEDCVDKRTRAVSVDWVHYLTGRRLNLKHLGAFCRKKGIFFIVDAIQGLGALHVDLTEVECDFFCAGASKWLLGPQGTGVLYVGKERFNELRPSNIGWLSAQWQSFEDFTVRPGLRPDAARFEEGTSNIIGICGMRENLRIIVRVGPREIEAKVMRLVRNLALGLLDQGCEILTPMDFLDSGILCFRSPYLSPSHLWDCLKTSDVVCSLRQGWVRVSPHFYNTDDEIDVLLDIVREQSKK